MSKEELLAVLDMDADNQFWAIQKYLPKDLAELYDKQEISLADLAFRLRDEVDVIGRLHKGVEAVCEISCPPNRNYVEWWIYEGKPIHWIVASLIAKEKLNE